METETKSTEAEAACEGAEKIETETTSLSETGDTTTQETSISNGDDADDDGGGEERETVEVKIIWNKKKYDLKIPIDDTGAKLKESIHSLTGQRSTLRPRFKAVLGDLTL